MQTFAAKIIPLREDYSDPVEVAAVALENLKAAIEAQFPIKSPPDQLTREARDHRRMPEPAAALTSDDLITSRRLIIMPPRACR
jgi:hypothetical protein